MELKIIRFFQSTSNTFFDVVFVIFSILASYTGLIILFCVLFLCAQKRKLQNNSSASQKKHSHKIWGEKNCLDANSSYFSKKYSFFFAGSFCFSAGFCFILKKIVGRPRPFEVYSSVVDKLKTVGESMPSSHMAGAAIISVFALWFILKNGKSKTLKIGAVFLFSLYLILVGISRIYLGQHYPSDVFVGLIIGIIIGILGVLCYNFYNRKVENGNKSSG